MGRGMTDAVINVPAVLLRINKQFEPNLSPEQLYERTRGYWAMAPDSRRRVEYAIAVAGGLIREVYRVDAWTRIAKDEISRIRYVTPTPTEFRAVQPSLVLQSRASKGRAPRAAYRKACQPRGPRSCPLC